MDQVTVQDHRLAHSSGKLDPRTSLENPLARRLISFCNIMVFWQRAAIRKGRTQGITHHPMAAFPHHQRRRPSACLIQRQAQDPPMRLPHHTPLLRPDGQQPIQMRRIPQLPESKHRFALLLTLTRIALPRHRKLGRM